MSANVARNSKGWIAWVVVNGLITFFGSSYIWFPGEAVVKAGYRTEGVLHVPAAAWGVYVILSAMAMLVVAVVGLRHNAPWARRAALYEFLFFLLVAAIEPDPVVPSIFGLVLGFTLWRSRSRPAEVSPPALTL